MSDPHLMMVLVDALRHDQISAELTPFIWEIARSGSVGATREPFAGQLRAAFFAGLHPNESGIGHLFCYDPAGSPFQAARWLPGVIDRWPRLSWWVRRALVARARREEIQRGHRGSASYCYLAEIPLTRLPLFAFSETDLPWEDRHIPRPGLLSILSAHRLPWLHLGYPVVDQRTAPLTEAAMSRMRPEHRLAFLHYAELDWAGHSHGPHSREARSTLAAIDAAIRSVWECARGQWADARLLLFGDHGMVPVHGTIDVMGALDGLPSRHGRDYAVFLDSTVARFWFLRDKARAPIVARLGALAGGRWLADHDLDRLHVRDGPARNGEAFWLADEGRVIMPSYFQRTIPPRGMHGYHPDVSDNWGALVTSDGSGPDHDVSLTDVFSLALRMLAQLNGGMLP